MKPSELKKDVTVFANRIESGRVSAERWGRTDERTVGGGKEEIREGRAP